MADDAKKVFDEFYLKLVERLPLKDALFLAGLTGQNLFSGTLKEEVMTAPTAKDATTRFLDKAIKRSLDIDDREAFNKLLLVMEKSGFRRVKTLAEQIKQKLNSIPEIGTSTPGQKRTSSPEQNTTSEPAENKKKASSQQPCKDPADQKKTPSPEQSTTSEPAEDKKKASSQQPCKDPADQKKTSSLEQSTTSEPAEDKKKTPSQQQCKDPADQKKTPSPEQSPTSEPAEDKKKTPSQQPCKDPADQKKTPSPEQSPTSEPAKDKKKMPSEQQCKDPADQEQGDTSEVAANKKQAFLPASEDIHTTEQKKPSSAYQMNTCSTTEPTKESPSFAEALESHQYHIKWTSCSNLLSELYNASVAVSSAGDTVYVTAWDAPDKNTESKVYCYTIKSDRWIVLPQPRHRRGVLCMLDDRLTIIGGDDPFTKEALNRVTTYNSYTNSWYKCYPNMLSKRFKPGVIIYRNYVMVMGGKNGKYTIYDSIEVMDYRNLRPWKAISAYLPIPMWNIKPIISGDNIAIVGYSTEERKNGYYQIAIETIISSVHQPFFSVTKWKRLLPAAHYETTAVPYSNPPVVIGGISRTYHGSILTSDVTLYDSSRNSWRKVDSLASARDCVGVGLINETTIIVIGGTRGGDDVKAAKASSLTTVEIGTIVPKQQKPSSN